MVLESLITPRLAETHAPWMLAIGMLYASVGLLLSYWVFKDYSSIVMILFIVLAAVPLFYSTMKYEESQVCEMSNEKKILVEHAKVVKFFTFFFIGLTVTFALWYLVLPAEMASSIFKVQTNTILNLNQQITGGLTQFTLFARIFFNNLKVLIFSLLFSFLFGSGAIFILTWNASVIGTAMGNFINTYATQLLSSSVGALPVYLSAAGLSILRYFIHGIPEIIAYFVGGLAGGIMSVAIIRGDLKNYFNRIVIDFSDLVIIALLFLLVAGLLEVFVTPIFFT